MDDQEFLKYFKNSRVPSYPDVKDEAGKCVILKVDSGPWRLNSDLLAYARNLGSIIFPIVPNITTVTQETDQNYGPLKTQFIEILNTLSDARIIHNDSTSLQPWMIGIILFGGIDPESKVYLKTSGFEKGF